MHRFVVITTGLLLVLGSACSGDPGSGESASTATETPRQSPPPPAGDAAPSTGIESAPTEWVAVYRTAPYPEEERTQFIDDAGRFICECPVSCFPGLDGKIDVEADISFLGLVAPTAERLERARGRVTGEPSFVGELPSLCRH